MTKLHFPSLHCLFLVCICVSTGVGWEVLWCRSVERYTIIEEYSPEATKHSGQRKQFAQVQIVLIFFFFQREQAFIELLGAWPSSVCNGKIAYLVLAQRQDKRLEVGHS